MSRSVIKQGALLPLMKPRAGWSELAKPNLRPMTLSRRQRGASLIMAIFLITALAALGGLLTQLLVLGSEETINEWYSAQSLYAAESGVEWAARDISAGGSGGISNGVVLTDQAWMTTTVSPLSIGGKTLYTITSTGTAGGSVSAPRSQRRIVVQFMP